jgi:flagellar biosynthesis/type III secretory pathway chaperone
MIDKVTALLRELSGVYEQLYDLSQQKQQSIIANDSGRVNEIVKDEWALVNKASDLEKKRNELVELHFGKGDGTQVTLDDVLSKAAAAEKEALKAEAGRLRDILEKQKKINQENQALIDLHLEYVDYMVNTVLKEPQISNIYGNSGTVEESEASNRGIIDNEA